MSNTHMNINSNNGIFPGFIYTVTILLILLISFGIVSTKLTWIAIVLGIYLILDEIIVNVISKILIQSEFLQ